MSKCKIDHREELHEIVQDLQPGDSFIFWTDNPRTNVNSIRECSESIEALGLCLKIMAQHNIPLNILATSYHFNIKWMTDNVNASAQIDQFIQELKARPKS